MRKLLLISGIISSLHYIVINIIVPLYYPGYNIFSFTVSELSAIDTPTRSLWVLLCLFYSLFIIAFGFGTWLTAESNKKIKIVALLLVVYGTSGFFWPPMHKREVIAVNGESLTDTMHIVFAVFTIILMIVMIIYGALALDRKFRIYSFINLGLFILFGILTSLESPGISTNQPTPFIGIWERINIGLFLAWIIAFAIQLMNKKLSPDRPS